MIDLIKRHPSAIRLFVASFLVLYLELALIRLSSAEAVYLGYFSNFVLIAVFLGIGVGFLLGEREIDLFRYTPQLLFGLIAFLLVTHIDASYLRQNLGQLFFGHSSTPMRIPLWLSLLLVFSTTAIIFAGIAQEAARCFRDFSPIGAYSIDIGGSLLGILLFTFHSQVGASPVTWFLVAYLLIAVLSFRYSLVNALAMGAGVLLLLVAAAPDHFTVWSPYQRIEVWPKEQGAPGYHLSANGIGHQTMTAVGSKEPIYDFPYREVRAGGYRRALIIGSGSGTDVAYALRNGVGEIDAVEIDPMIAEAGHRFHPGKPYADQRVTVHIDDGRAFMEQTDKRYDLIVYALPDSLAGLSGFANIRLESFLFTVESLRQARRLLTEDGVLVLYNFYRKKWLVEKLDGMLTEVFGHPPVLKAYTGERRGMLAAFAIGPRLSGPSRSSSRTIPPSTDDWPFLYMQRPHLPSMYILIMLLFVACGAVAVGFTGHARVSSLREGGVFALMGAAFLLLETKSIIQFLLLFGATWIVNSLVFAGILASVLLANLIVQRSSISRPAVLFVPLLATLALQFLLPLSTLLQIESVTLRYLAASFVLFSPIFCANLAFGLLFKGTRKAASAFGWNIIGTMIGGALEYTSLAIGYQSLTLVVTLLYAVCFGWAVLLRRRIS